MKEEFLHYLWKYQLFGPKLKTTQNKILDVLKPGESNLDSGPDFFNARIRLDETVWAGNIEIHVNSSAWKAHNHQNDPVYDNVILHVVYTDDKPVRRKNGELIPTLELKHFVNPSTYERYNDFINSTNWIACENQISGINYFTRNAWLDSLIIERLNNKASAIDQELSKTGNDLEEVFYRKMARNFGFKTNAAAFEMLAINLPLKIVIKHSGDLIQLEALFFGTAGMLDKKFNDEYPEKLKSEFDFLSKKYNIRPVDIKLWKFMRMRPANFPTIRISQFANLLHRSSGLLNQLLKLERLQQVTELLKVKASDYWHNHYRFDKKSEANKKLLGQSSVNLIVVNTIIPYLFVYGQRFHNESHQQKALDWLELIGSENNTITRHFDRIGLKATNAMQSQALIQLKNEYCNPKRCLECRIGHELLKSP